MAESIVTKESDTEIKALSSSQHKRVYTGLHQCHLLKMNPAGIVDSEKNRGGITPLDTVEQLNQYLNGDIVSTDADNEQSAPLIAPSKRNLAVATGVAVTILDEPLGVLEFEQVPTAGWVALSTATLTAITAMESHRDRPDL